LLPPPNPSFFFRRIIGPVDPFFDLEGQPFQTPHAFPKSPERPLPRETVIVFYCDQKFGPSSIHFNSLLMDPPLLSDGFFPGTPLQSEPRMGRPPFAIFQGPAFVHLRPAPIYSGKTRPYPPLTTFPCPPNYIHRFGPKSKRMPAFFVVSPFSPITPTTCFSPQSYLSPQSSYNEREHSAMCFQFVSLSQLGFAPRS